MTNALAYYGTAQITAVNSFIGLARCQCNFLTLCYSPDLDFKYLPAWEGLDETNALSYLASPLVTKIKSLMALKPGVSVIKLFFPSLLTTRPNNLECLYLAIIVQSSLTFAGNTRSLSKKEASERFSDWVCTGLALKF